MKVNMTPNPLDVVTIHASQGDTEARQWEFELHNNGELIDTSDVKEQMFFKSYKGGTEQLLPENTSTPTTSPFKGDIKYPQGLLSDQEFLYRESPTEEDGYAKITDIKGNTIVWNQIFPTKTVNYTGTGYTLTSNNDGKYVLTVTETATQDSSVNHSSFILPVANRGHKLLLLGSTDKIAINYKAYVAWGNRIYQSSSTDGYTNIAFTFTNLPVGTYTLYPQIFDLTQMFGAGNEPTTVEEFTSLFPLAYSYNAGTLLSFNGTGIKTVGKNILVDSGFVRGVLGWNSSPSDSDIVINNAYLTTPFIPIPQGVSQITLSAVKGNITRYWEADANFNGLYFNGNRPNEGQSITRTLSAGCRYIRISIGQDGLAILPSDYGTVVYGQIEFGNEATDYEPYTTQTTNLPISTYFPTGMKSAGSVYDELTESKAITRVGSVDLGSLTYTYTQSSLRFEAQMPSNYKIPTSISNRGNMICAKYSTNANPLLGNGQEGITGYQNSNKVFISDQSTTDPTVFKTMMNGVVLYYELATPTETSFTTASLVTENTEIPLSNEDGVLIGKCTEELSENPGFIDAKIKLSDADGECYSNKIQLHVERSPQ